MTDEALKPVEIKGPNLEEAIKAGLDQLGLTRNEVIIEIVEEGGAGFFGMGAKDAIVRIIPLKAPTLPVKPAPKAVEQSIDPHDDIKVTIPAERIRQNVARESEKPAARPVEQALSLEEAADEANDPLQYDPTIDYRKEAGIARDTLQELLEQMDIHAEITMQPLNKPRQGEEPAGPWLLNIQGKDLGILIGRRGETLNALQFLARLIVSRELQQRSSFVVDVEGYKMRREDTLKSLAHRMAARAKSQGKTMTLEPMPPNERRIIHLTLRNDKAVKTESVGSGERRKVTIIPNVSQK